MIQSTVSGLARTKMKVNNVFRIPSKTIKEFYTQWIDFLTPIHGLSNKNKEILVEILVYRYELSQKISSEELLNDVLLNEDSKKYLKEKMNLKGNYLQVALFTLAEHKVLIKKPIDEFNERKFKYRINPMILPDMEVNDSHVVLQFNFDIKCNSQKQ